MIKNKGITLIALVITIIVLLILAGITIATLVGDNGILTKTEEAKEQTEIGKEKEQIKLAINSEMVNNLSNNVTKEGLQKELDNSEGYGKTEVKKNKEKIEVLFKESNRYYVISSNGEISEYKDYIKDTCPGDITKDKDGNILDGTLEKPYKIYCIEDLIDFSRKVNDGYFKGKSNYNVILMRDLDFESDMSYMDSLTKEYNELLKVEDNSTLIEALTKKDGKGFYPIGLNNEFSGIFDGKNYTIENIYENRSIGAFFFNVNNAIIKNTKITGEINGESDVGGLIYSANNCKIYNCMNKINITGQNAGGICCIMSGKCYINNSLNLGEIRGKWQRGSGGILGIYGSIDETMEIQNSYNFGRVSMTNGVSYCAAGGIIGYASGTNIKIYNCYNKGEITSSKHLGAIVGSIGKGTIELNNCYFQDNVEKEIGDLESNKAVKITSAQCKNEEKINEKNLIDLLNEYVKEYNNAETKLCFWTKELETGYPILDY